MSITAENYVLHASSPAPLYIFSTGTTTSCFLKYTSDHVTPLLKTIWQFPLIHSERSQIFRTHFPKVGLISSFKTHPIFAHTPSTPASPLTKTHFSITPNVTELYGPCCTVSFFWLEAMPYLFFNSKNCTYYKRGTQ